MMIDVHDDICKGILLVGDEGSTRLGLFVLEHRYLHHALNLMTVIKLFKQQVHESIGSLATRVTR